MLTGGRAKRDTTDTTVLSELRRGQIRRAREESGEGVRKRRSRLACPSELLKETCGEICYLCERRRDKDVQGLYDSEISDIKVSKPSEVVGTEIVEKIFADSGERWSSLYYQKFYRIHNSRERKRNDRGRRDR